MAARYLIGIDLGTTNCVLAYLAAAGTGRGPRVLPLPQWESPLSVVPDQTLPSFYYLTTGPERQAGFAAAAEAPAAVAGWVPGRFARERLALNPERVIHSAKSWLCHGGVDRTAPILPWQSTDVPPGERLSPVQASAAYLAYLRDVWNRCLGAAVPEARFENQEIVLTVPASFDEAAQQLTFEAAQMAGYPQNIRLLEEPQAAFYDWLGQSGRLRSLSELLAGTEGGLARVLVCDIGGGTTDLSLFEVAADPLARTGLALTRVAVSEHLLLGGDNIDLTLALILEQKLTGGGTRLAGRQWNQLLVQARQLKERLLADRQGAAVAADTEFPVSLAGSGAGLLGSTLTTRINAEQVRQCVLEGFFPECSAADRPRKGGAGLKEWGLPFAEDSAITRHLAGFLEDRRIDAVLFNGGTVTPAFLRERLVGLITRWQDGRAPAVLTSTGLSLAVARGAARYGWILRQPEAAGRIAGGHAHALYLEVRHGKKGQNPSLVCILPRGLEANQAVRIDSAAFDLLVNQPVRFQCYYSHRRQGDGPGEIVSWNERDFHPLPPLQTAIHLPAERPRPANNRLRVTLEATLNELGLLQLYCVEATGGGRWRLDFNLRRGVEEPQPAPAAEEPLVSGRRLEQAEALLRALYGKKKDPRLPQIKPRQLIRELEKVLGDERENWDSATLRALWPSLAQGMTRRGRSADHEAAWLYLAGYALRPGYGYALDESRVEELWRLFAQGMAFAGEKRVQVQWYLLWRRTAGGLNARRQEKIFNRIFPNLRSQARETAEILYLAGSLERLRTDQKLQLVKALTTGLETSRLQNKEPYAWALGRLLSRTPLYAGPEAVLPPGEVEKLFARLRDLDWRDPAQAPLIPLLAQAARRTDLRDVDVDPGLRLEILEKMKEGGARQQQLRVVREMIAVDDSDRVRQFGESLPSGLILVAKPV